MHSLISTRGCREDYKYHTVNILHQERFKKRPRNGHLMQTYMYQSQKGGKHLTYITLVSFLWNIGKQHSPRCDAAKRGVPSGAILFAQRNFIEK